MVELVPICVQHLSHEQRPMTSSEGTRVDSISAGVRLRPSSVKKPINKTRSKFKTQQMTILFRIRGVFVVVSFTRKSRRL